jgi:hypothetical protein
VAKGGKGGRSGNIDLAEAVKRADKAIKRETGSPPKPYREARPAKRKPKAKGARR